MTIIKIKVQKGSSSAIILIFFSLMSLFTVFFAVTLLRTVTNSVLHELKNDIYMINKNVLFSLNRASAGKDVYKTLDIEHTKKIKQEILELWQLDNDLKNGKRMVDEAKIVSLTLTEEDSSLNSDIVLKIKLKNFLFNEKIGDKRIFTIHENIKFAKMKTRGIADEIYEVR